MKSRLYLSELTNLHGKLIEWSAPAYRLNKGFWGYGEYGGYATVKNNALVTILGDEIEFAQTGDKDFFYYSDDDRYLTHRIVYYKGNVEELLKIREEAIRQVQSLFSQAEAQSNYKELSNWRNRPQRNKFYTKEEYIQAEEKYITKLNSSYTIYQEFEKQAETIKTQTEEKLSKMIEEGLS